MQVGNCIQEIKKLLNQNTNLTWKEKKQDSLKKIKDYMREAFNNRCADILTIEQNINIRDMLNKYKQTFIYVLEKIQKLLNKDQLSNRLSDLKSFNKIKEQIKCNLDKDLYEMLTGEGIDFKLSNILFNNLKIAATHKYVDGIRNNSNIKTKFFAKFFISVNSKYDCKTDTINELIAFANKDFEFSNEYFKNINKELEEYKNKDITNKLEIKGGDAGGLSIINNNSVENVKNLIKAKPKTLRNYGNTCFINVALQLIVNNDILTRELLSHSDLDIRNYFSKMMFYYTNNNEFIKYHKLLTKILLKKYFQGKREQQDASELIMFIFDESPNFYVNTSNFFNDLNTKDKNQFSLEQISSPKDIDFTNFFRNKIDINEVASIIVHQGGRNAGHYISFVNKDNKWYLCNDEIITEIAGNDIIKKILSVGTPTCFNFKN